MNKRMQCKNLKFRGYSESKVSRRLHQNSDLEARKCSKAFKRGLLGPVTSTIHKM